MCVPAAHCCFTVRLMDNKFWQVLILKSHGPTCRFYCGICGNDLVFFFIQCLNTSCTNINLGHSCANRKVVWRAFVLGKLASYSVKPLLEKQ